VFSYVPLRILASKGLLRVSTEAELVGLNFSEHGESLQIDEIERLIVDAIGAQPDAANTDSTGSTILHEKSLLGDTISKLVLDKKNIEESLQQQKQRLHNLAKAKADVVWETDSELMVNTCETSEAELQVFLNQSFINRHLFDSLALDSKNYPSVLGRLENLQPTGKFTSEIKSRERSVDSRHFEIVCTPTFDSAGNFSGFTGSLNDITSKVVKEKNDYLKTLMDASSGLGNSKAMGIALKTRLNRARNSKRSICIACMELAECTSGNGVQKSNALPRVIVREIVAIANNSLGAEDRIFHTDASQLLIILDDLPFKRAQEMAQTVCNRIATEINKNFCKVNVNADTRFVCKMGFAIYPQDGQSASTLQDRAGSALKAAIGNDNCHVLPFETDAESKMRVREARKQELEQAIDNDEFFLVYQPQIETSSQTVTGFEALVRWQHPERGIVPPFEFIEDVESLGLMCRLGMVVLEKAAIFAKDLNQRYNGSQLSVAVNVSPTQIQTDGFVDKALDIIKKYELTSHCLHLEITEEAYISDFKGLRVKLETLIDHGFQLALDDFGTGNTSLVYLQELPANKLKIDKSFVDSIIDSEQASSVARGILELGRKMDMTVTAEGVENVDQFELLREWGCDEIQGFYFAKPMSYQEAMIYPESAIGGAEAA